LKKELPLAVLLILIALVSGVQAQLSFSDSEISMQEDSGSETGQWQVYFNPGEAEQLTFSSNYNNDLAVESVEYYQDGAWRSISTDNALPANFEWPDGAIQGRITMNITQFRDFSGSLTTGTGESVDIQTYPSLEQQQTLLNLDDEDMDFSLCGFAGDFRQCNPSQNEPGSSGETVNLDNSTERTLEIPANSQITDFSFNLSSIDDRAIQNFEKGNMLFADTDGDGESEIVTYDSNSIEVYSSEGTLEQSYSTSYTINDVASGPVVQEEVVDGGDDLVVSTTNSLLVLSSGETEWSIEGEEFDDVATGEVSSDRKVTSLDDGSAESMQCIGCGGSSATFNIPEGINDSQEVFYLNLGLNYIDNSQDLTLEIGNNTYPLNTDSLTEDSITESKNDDGSIEQIVEVNNNPVNVETPENNLNAENRYLKIPVAKPVNGSEGSVNITINSSTYSFSTDDIHTTSDKEVSSAYSDLNSLIGVEDSIEIDTGVLNENRSSYIRLPVNKHPNEDTGSLELMVNGESYNIDTSQVAAENIKEYQGDNGNSVEGLKISGNAVDFNLFYDMPQSIEAEKLYIKTGVARVGSGSGNITVKAGDSTYKTALSNVETDSTQKYSIYDDNTSDERHRIGLDNSSEAEFDISAFNTDKYGETLDLSFNVCRTGDAGQLEIGGPAAEETYSINSSEIASCDTGPEWATVEVDGSALSNNYLQFRCEGCSENNSYSIGLDNSTNSDYSRIYNNSISGYNNDIGGDFLVKMETETALDYEFVTTEVDASDITPGENITYGCEGCNTDNSYRIMKSDASTGHTWSNDEQVSNDIISRVWTNSSLERDWIRTRVDNQDLINDETVSINCVNCQEGFNILSDTGSTGSTYRNSNTLDRDAGIEITQYPLNHEWVKVPISKSDKLGNAEIESNTTIYLGLDESSTASASRNGETFDRGSTARLWSNRSLAYDELRVEVDKTAINNNENATIYSSGIGYNLMIDESSSLNSWRNEGTTEPVNGGYIVSLESFGSNLGGEVAASQFPSELNVFNSTGSRLWNQSLNDQVEDIEIGDVDSSTGNEVVAATRDHLQIVSSTGDNLRSYPEDNNEWFRAIEINNSNIIGGTDSGVLKSVDSSNSVKWQKDLGNRINSLTQGNLVKDTDTSLAVGHNNGSIGIYDLNGSKIASYSRGNSVQRVDSGSSNNINGDLLGVSTDNAEILNIYSLAENLQINIDGEVAATQTGLLRGSLDAGDSSVLQNQVSDCSSGMCEIPVTIQSDSPAKANISNIRTDFIYDINSFVNSQDGINSWERTSGIQTGESIRNQALEINYTGNPAVPIQVNQLISDNIDLGGGTTNVTFNNRTFENPDQPSINLEAGLLEFMLPTNGNRDTDRVWYDNSATGTPVTSNSSSLDTSGSISDRTVNVTRNTELTGDVFRNVTTIIELNEDEIKGGQFIEVDWKDNGFTDITPETEGCSTYSSQGVDGDTFKTCLEDENGNGIAETIEIIQPRVGAIGSDTAETTYRVGGTSNYPPTLEEVNITPSSGYWNTTHNVSVSFTDQEDDPVEASLWIETGSGWIKEDTDSEGLKKSFNFSTEKEWTGQRDILIEYTDLDDNGDAIRPRTNSSAHSFQVDPRPTSIEIITGPGTEKDRIGETSLIEAVVRDEVTGDPVGDSEALCYVNTESDMAHDIQSTNENGQCNLGIGDLPDASVGDQEWWLEASGQNYYTGNTTDRQNITLIGNYSYDATLEDERIYVPNGYGLLESTSLNVENIQDLTGEPRNPGYSVFWTGEEIEGGEVTGNSISGDTTYISGTPPGTYDLTVQLEEKNFNTAFITRSVDLWDGFEPQLNSSADVIDKSEKINLTAEFISEDDAGNIEDVNPETVSFETPPGYCGEEYVNGNRYTCEFVPASDLESGSYNWSVDASKQNYKFISDNSSFEIAGDILADIEVEQNELSRVESGSRTNTLNFIVDNVTDESGSPIQNVNYNLTIEGEVVVQGDTGDSNSATGSYTIPTDQAIGPNEVSIVIEAGDKQLSYTDSVTVYGLLDIQLTTNGNEVYLSNSVTDNNESLNTETNLTASATNQLGENVDADIDYSPATGNCNMDGDTCQFEPRDTEPGNYSWSASADAQYYEPVTSGENLISVKDVVTISEITETVTANFTESSTFETQLQNPDGETITANGFSANYAGDATSFTNGTASIGFTPTCGNYSLGPQTETVELTGSSEFYTIYSPEENFAMDVYNVLNPEITSPLDSSNQDAENYRQGDEVNMNVDISAACSISSDDYQVLWTAQSQEESSVVSSGESTTWTIEDRFSGPTDIIVEVDNDYYLKNTDTNEIVIDRVLNNDITSSPDEFTRKFNNANTAEFTSKIKTGQGVLANKSSISEDWSNFEVVWYVNGEQKTTTSTNSNGVATGNLDLESYDLGDVNVEAELSNTTNIDTRILQDTDSATTKLLDEARVTINTPVEEKKVFYTDEVTLDSTLDFVTVNDPANIQDLEITWSYNGTLTENPNTISSSQQSSWTIPSYVYGNGTVTAHINAPLIEQDTDSNNLIGKRKVSIENFNPPQYLEPDAVNTLKADIAVDGLEDLSGYPVELWRGSPGNDTVTAETDENGTASLEWDTREYSTGAYDTGIQIYDNQSQYFETEAPTEEETTIVIPDTLNISAHFRDNLERDSRGNTYDNLPEYVVYRNGGPWQHPETMHLAANVTTPFQSSEELYEVENSTVEFWIQGQSADGENINEKIGEDKVNLTEYQQGRTDNTDQWWDEYLAYTEWQPRGNFPVGEYDLKINASHPEESFSPEPVNDVPIEVRGTLNVTIEEPTDGRTDYQMDNMTLSAVVEDMNGNQFTESELDGVYWSLDEDYCLGGGVDGQRNSNEVIDWDDAIAHGDRNSLSSWIVPGNPSRNGYNLGGGETAYIGVEKKYFESVQNSYRTGFLDCSSAYDQWSMNPGYLNGDYEGPKENIVGQRHDLRARIVTEWDSPTQTTVGTDDNDILNATAFFREFNTSQGLPNGYNGQFHATCLNCSDPRNKDLSQHANHYRDDSEAKFQFNFSNEEYGQNYTFKIWASTSNDWEAEYPRNTTTETLEVFRDIGSGDGSANINGICEPDEGENVGVAPSDCGFDNLPKEYWVNETAQALEGQLSNLPENYTTQYNRFANESHPEYEAGVRWYGEHSMYDDSIAGGCDFDEATSGENDTVYEARNSCSDWIIEERPPEIKDIDATPGYFLSSGTEQNIWTKVDAPNENLDIVQLIRKSDGEVIDSDMSLVGDTSYPREFETNFIPSKDSDTTYTIEATTQDGLKDSKDFTLYYDNGNTAVGSITFNEPLIPYSDSGETSTITVNMNFGNINQKGIKNVTANIENSGTVTLSYEDNGQYKGQFEATDTGDGTGSATVTANMKAGYSDTMTEDYNLDTEKPSITNLDIQPTLVAEGYEITANADLSDDNNLKNVALTNDADTELCSESETGTSGTFDCTVNIQESGTGEFTYTVTAEDTAGRTGSSSINLTVDNNKPELSNINYEEVVEENTTTTISADAIDNEDHLESLEVVNQNKNTVPCVNDNLGGVNSNSISCDVTPSENTYYMIRANDSLGNTQTNSFEIITVSEPPNLNFNNPASSAIVNGNIDIDVHIDDPDNALDESTPYIEVISNADSTISYENSLSGSGDDTVWSDSLDTSTLSDGGYTLNASASDLGGLLGTNQIDITVDNTAPTISFDNLNSDEIVSGDKNFQFTISDQNPDSSTYEYIITDSTGATTSGSLTGTDPDYETGNIDTTSLAEGDANIEVTATDAAGNTNSVNRNFNIDNEAPEVTITSPESGTHVRNDFTIKADITDQAGNGDPNTYECRVASGSWQAMNSGECTLDSTSYSNGDTNIEVQASDTLGQTGSDSRSITIDNEAPSITNVTLGNNIVNSDTTIDVTVDTNDNQAVTEVTADGNTLNLDSGTIWTGTITATGNHLDTKSVNVESSDQAGNTAADTSTSYTIDDQAPAYSGQNVDTDYMTSGESVQYSVTINEEHLVEDSVTIEIVDSADNVVDTVSESCNFGDSSDCSASWDGTNSESSNVPDGSYRFKISASDKAGNSNSNIYSESVTVDNTNPQFSNFGSNKEYIKEGENVTFSVDVEETSFDQSQTSVNVIQDTSGDVAATISNPSCNGDSGSYTCKAEWTATEGSYSTGSYYPEISTTDKAGNSNTGSDSSASTTLDTQNPSIISQNILNAENTIFNSEQTIDVEVEASDSETFVDTVTADGNPLGNETSEIWTGTVSPADSEGDYSIDVQVSDAADNNVSSSNLGYTVDNTPPTISNLTSNATEGVSRSDAEVKFEVTVTDSNLDTVTLKGQTMTAGSGDKYTLTTTPNNLGLSEGENTLTATATDKADNTNTATYNLYVDDGAPVISNIDVSDEIVQSNTAITVSAEVTDDFIRNVTLDHNGETLNMESTSETNVYDTTLQTSGNNEEIINLTVNAIDEAGNTASDSSADYQIDDTPPSTGALTIAGQSELVTQSGNTSEFSVDVTDNLGVQNVELLIPDGRTGITDEDGDNAYTSSLSPAELGCTTGTDYSECQIGAEGTDQAGNTDLADSNATLYVDDVAPSINSFTVNNSIVQTGTTVKFEAEITDDDDQLTNTVRNPSGEQVCELNQDSSNIYSCTTSVDEEGSYTLESLDRADNTRTSNTDINIDDTPPQIDPVDVNATHDASRSDADVLYEVQVSDSNIDRVYIPEIDGSTEFNMTPADGERYSLTATPAELGCTSGVNNATCDLQVNAVDDADNLATQQFSQTVDDTPPSITTVEMQRTILKPDSDVQVSVEADGEGNSTLDLVEAEPNVSDNELSWSSENGNWTGTITIGDDEVLDIYAEDYASNTDTDDSQSYTIDNEPPEITDIGSNATRNISRSDSDLEFSLTATDNVEMDKVRIGTEGNLQEITGSQDQYSTVATPAELGCNSQSFANCTIKAEATDRAGYTVTKEYDLTIDDESPTITDVSLNDTILQPGFDVEANISISGEDNYTVDTVRSLGKELDWVESKSHWNGAITPSEESEGTYNLQVEAEDYADNIGQDSSTTYTIDTTPPEIMDLTTTSTDDIETSESVLSYTVNTTDNNGVQNVSINGEKMEYRDGNTYNLTAPLEDLGCTENGVCTLNATVYDEAELTNHTTYNITIDNDAPQIVDYTIEGVIEGDPYDAALPTFELDWRVNTSSQTNTTAEVYATNMSTEEKIGPAVSLYENESDKGFFYRELQTQELNATGGLVSFIVNITDDAGNIGQGNYTLNLDTVPPSIEGLDTNISDPEVSRETVELQANITHNVEVAQVNATITSEKNDSFEKEIEMELPPQNEAEDSSGGVFVADFTPPYSGDYNVNIYAEDDFNEYDDTTFENVFSAIGTTELDLMMTPEISEFDSITTDNKGNLLVETNLTNTGEVTAYGAAIPRLSLPEGTETNSTAKKCGDLEAGESCSVMTEINFTVDTEPGLRNIIANGFWDNPDRTTSITAKGVSTNIVGNPVMEITSNQDSHYQDVLYGESGEINVTVTNRGNVPLNNLDASLGTTGLNNSNIASVGNDVSLEPRAVAVGEESNTTVNILETAEDRGRYEAELDISSSDYSCGENCQDTTEFTAEIFRRSYVNITNSSQEIYRNETVNLSAEVIDGDDNLISGYPVDLRLNETGIVSESTDGSGEVTQEVNIDAFEPGNYTLLAEIQDLESDYYRTENATDTESFEIRDSLNLTANYSSDSLFWYNTSNDDDQITINYSVTNVNGNPVEDVNITLLSNATTNESSNYTVKGSALTDENGEGTIVYQTDADSPGNASLKTTVDKNQYYDIPAAETKDIQIKGGFSVRIVNVDDGDKILRNQERDLIAEITDDSGEPLAPSDIGNITWTLNDTELTAGNNTDEFNWTIPADQETDNYELMIEAEDDGTPPVTESVDIGIYEAINLQDATVSTTTTDRKDSNITFEASVANSSGSSVSGYEGCTLLVEESEINQSVTGGAGSCTLDWYTDNQSKVGNNTAEVSLAEDRSGTWYLPNSSASESFNVFLEEKINLEIIEPATDLYTHEEYSFEANTTDAYGRNLETNTSWFVNEELIGYNSTAWNTTNTTLGEHTLNVTSERTPFNSTYVEKTLRLFGRSEHTLSVDEEVSRGQNATITVNVTDINTTEGIEDYNITLYKTKDGNTEKWDSIITNATGVAVKDWDTGEAELGSHNITAELGDSSDLYYNSTSGNLTENIYVGGEISTDVQEVTYHTVYRDKLTQPQNTTLRINNTNDIGDSLEGVNNTLIIDNQSVARCSTNSTGLCNITWNPDSSTEIGNLSGYINSTSNNYFPANSSTFNIEVRTGSKPELGIDGETGYNFSKSTGVPINVSVLESFTDRAVANYSFDLGWGTRDPLVPVYSNDDNWNADNTSRINGTENNLVINNTTAFRSFEELSEIDRTVIHVEKKDSTVWNVSLDMETGVIERSTNNSRIEINTDNSTVSQLNISTSGSVNITDGELGTLELDNRRELMDSELLGTDTGSTTDRGDFVNATVSETIGETPGGWYVTGSESVESSLAEGTFGTPSLQLDLNEFSSNDEAKVIREYSNRDGSTAYEEFEILEFWINSELNSTLTLNGETCSQSYNVSTGSWRPVQLNLTDYHNSCGEKIMNWKLSFQNSGEEPVSTQVNVDQFRRYKPADTGSEAVKTLDWLPPEAGVYSFRMDINNSKYYNTTKETAIADLEVLSTGGGESATDSEQKIPEGGGIADNFEIVQESINQTVGLNTYGELDPITVDNTGTQTLNISTGFPEGSKILENTENTVIEPGEEKDINLRYQTSETGNFVTTVAVFDQVTDNRKDIPVNVTVAPVEMSINSVESSYGSSNITPGDNITVDSQISVDSEPVTENVDWQVNVGDTSCEKHNQSYSNTTDSWTTNCTAPEIDYNPLQPDLELIASYNGIEIRDNTTIGYRDITGPFVEFKNAENVEQGQTTDIAVEAWDNTGISSVSGYVEGVENNSNIGQVVLDNTEGDFYNTSFTILESIPNGDYDVVLNLTDTNGNIRTTRVPFSVYPFVEVKGNTTPGTTFEFKRPGTDAELESFTTENQSYNFSVQNRTYDTELETDTVNSDGNIQRQNLEFNNATINGNMSNPVNVSGGETGQDVPYDYPDNTTNLTFSHVSYSTGFNYSSAEVTLDYSQLGSSPDEVPEEEFSVYRCPADDVTKCETANWTKLNTSIDTEQDIATAETGTSSSYILARETTDDGQNDGENDGQDDGGTDGEDGEDSGGSDGSTGGGGFISVPPEDDGGTDGNNTGSGGDDAGSQPFSITPRIYHPVMERGETQTYFLEIVNNRQNATQVNISVDGQISQLLTFSEEAVSVPGESTSVTEMTVSIPSDIETGNYNGNITASYGNFSTTSNHQILVETQGQGEIELDVTVLTQTIQPGENMSYNIEIGDTNLETPINSTIEQFVRNSDTDEVVHYNNMSRMVNEGSSIQREVDMSNQEIGSYYVQTVLKTNNTVVSATDTFAIRQGFWTPFRRRAVMMILLTLLLTVASWKGYQRYWERKEDDSRYVFPVDYDKLPEESEDNFWTGKIAETDKDSYIDPKDLTTHTIVSGSTGSGKSVTANIIAEEALENDIPVIVFDPTAQWTGFVKELQDDNLKEHYDRFGMNEEEDPHPYRGTIKEIDSAEPEIDFEELKNPGEVTVFTLNQLTTEEFDQAVRKIIDQIFDKEWEESPDLEMLVVFDEVHRLLEEYGGEGGYHALEKGAREFRKWGIGLMMCSQVTADFKQAISGNIMTEIQMQTKSMSDIDRIETKYGEEFAKRISSEDIGVGMIQNSNYNDGDPWFVDFRPTYHNPHKIPDQELQKYHNLSEELSQLKNALAEKEDAGEEIRDKKLELQLAENKLKEGRFKMANMYINSLKDEMGINEE
jgi:hypothetical protein